MLFFLAGKQNLTEVARGFHLLRLPSVPEQPVHANITLFMLALI
jgi:hypothetical protein